MKVKIKRYNFKLKLKFSQQRKKFSNKFVGICLFSLREITFYYFRENFTRSYYINYQDLSAIKLR